MAIKSIRGEWGQQKVKTAPKLTYSLSVYLVIMGYYNILQLYIDVYLILNTYSHCVTLNGSMHTCESK
jgi:hypothetical protein